MGHLLLIILVIVIGCCAIIRPWIGVASYYLLAILGPQYIWWWDFKELRVSFIVAICTFVGFAFKLFNQDLELGFLKTRLNFWVFVLWVFIDLSYFLGSFIGQFQASGLTPIELFSITNKMFSIYFIAVLVMNGLKPLQYFGYMAIFSTLYMIYWANTQYLSQNWSQFNMGRLKGPSGYSSGSIYSDENAFAMLFVTGIPFLYFFGLRLRRPWQRYLLLCLIPLGWHAVFLTGSRGSFLGLFVITMLMALKNKRKAIYVPFLMFLLIIAFEWQGGSVMKHRSQTISQFEDDTSADNRLIAWKGGLKMVFEHPLFGVGLGAFDSALPNYTNSRHMVAHNTFVQIAAESGAGAGLAYLMIVWIFLTNSHKISSWCQRHDNSEEMHNIECYNNASTTSFVGFVVCSMFLSLSVYEIFTFNLIFNNALQQICLRKTNC